MPLSATTGLLVQALETVVVSVAVAAQGPGSRMHNGGAAAIEAHGFADAVAGSASVRTSNRTNVRIRGFTFRSSAVQ